MIKIIRSLALLMLFVWLVGGAARPALAQEPARSEAYVYATQFYDGLSYRSALVPPASGTIYLTADVTNILAFRRTQIYFWPLTNRTLADWNRLNDLVTGELEVYRNDQPVTTLALTDYVIQYDSENMIDTIGLHVGTEAQARHLTFAALQSQYQQRLFDYYEATQAWRQERERIMRETPAGLLDVNDLPDPPAEVARFTLFSTDIRKGFALALPAGQYRIQVRDAAGEVIPESRKTLVVFDALSQAVSYTVVPENRWTRPEESNDPNAVIYAVPGTRLYLEPYRMHLYNELHYTRMEDPQDEVARADRTRAVVFQPHPARRLALRAGNRLLPEQTAAAFSVQQLPGDSLGYEVKLFDPQTMGESSFEGFQLDFAAANAYTIELLDENGVPIAGSQRAVRLIQPARAWLVYALSALPLLAGLVVIGLRRLRLSSVSEDAESIGRLSRRPAAGQPEMPAADNAPRA